MTESVTDIIVSRSQHQERWPLMMAGSALAHLALLALAILLPHSFSDEEPVRQVMMITLGGAAGPDTGGLTPIGGRAVQEVAPPEPPKPPDPPPAPEKPKMTLPDPKPLPRAEARKKPEETIAKQAPTTGPEVTEGSTPVDTGARGEGFGISSSGRMNDSPVQLDVSDFCCPEYLDQMIAIITRNWHQDQGRPGSSIIKFTIARDGTISAVTIDRTSGFFPLDSAAQRAVQRTRLLPLPGAFPNPTLTVHMRFTYTQ